MCGNLPSIYFEAMSVTFSLSDHDSPVLVGGGYVFFFFFFAIVLILVGANQQHKPDRSTSTKLSTKSTFQT